jgi:hypothetical protein
MKVITEKQDKPVQNIEVFTVCSYTPLVFRWLSSLESTGFDAKNHAHILLTNDVPEKILANIKSRVKTLLIEEMTWHKDFRENSKYGVLHGNKQKGIQLFIEYGLKEISGFDLNTVLFYSDAFDTVFYKNPAQYEYKHAIFCADDCLPISQHPQYSQIIDKNYSMLLLLNSGVYCMKVRDHIYFNGYCLHNQGKTTSEKGEFNTWIYSGNHDFGDFGQILNHEKGATHVKNKDGKLHKLGYTSEICVLHANGNSKNILENYMTQVACVNIHNMIENS